MADPRQSRPEVPSPHDILYDDGGSVGYLLASDWEQERIDSELEYLDLDAETLDQVWLKPRWTTPEELADPDRLYELFGDTEMNGVCTDVVYDKATAETPGAHLYLACG